ncbi:MAG: N-6 DNA methylase [Syntrophobacteraceae bacterium]|nr:N-6 DNA methylase [Syntrophobacteraceae bacterium]
MSRRSNAFQTIRSEGGLLPPDLLRRVLEPKEKLPGTRPEDYGLPVGERLNEVITQSWNRLRKHWMEFQSVAANLPDGEPATGLTNEKWSLPLLRELGFGLLPTSAGPEVGGRTYAINRLFGSVPVHLVGCGLSLDRRAAGVRGAAAANPHGLVQEFLNRSSGHLWGIVSNGLQLRVLRDSQALSRQSFLEFDLETIFAGEVYSDFVLLWLMAHATRFAPRKGDRPETCWLEEWTKLANEQGTRALGDLRTGVEKALKILGEGFTSHPKNIALRNDLRTGQIPLADFHGQLLRLVYRLIFLFVAEDRTIEGQSMLHPSDESDTARLARERYAAHYSTGRLRELASRIKGSRHGDLWKQFQLLVGAFSGSDDFVSVRKHLALPVLGGFLWDPASTAALNSAELINHDFLEALRHLAFTRQGKVLRPVDYKNLGAEELGGVYESLLALTPQISADGARFTFAEFAGNERKTSGSYYTPDSLVQCLLDSALDPVVEEVIKGKTGADAERAILSLKVCDPAVGSGHFLVGAAHRLARHLARVRALGQGESEPSPLLYQRALRDIIGRCLYGVDVNPMAAELCRVSLWLEALEPGKPLSFLDHHIRVGNSLLGATPELIAAGLPDDAFKPIEGDDRAACAELKKRNRAKRKGWGPLFARQDAETQAHLQQASAALEEISDDRPDDIHAKELAFRRHEQTEEYRQKKKLADVWCAAFVIQKHFLTDSNDPGLPSNQPFGITQGHLNGLASGWPLTSELSAEIDCLSLRYQFFHWHLAFPDVFASGGFHCVLANPPWERVKIQEKEWFAERCPEIANAPNSAARKRLIETLKVSDPDLYQQFLDDLRKADGEAHLMRNSGCYPLCGRGDINLYTIFAERMRNLLNDDGRVGCVLPTGIATDDTTKFFFQDIIRKKSLASLYSFENEEFVFPEIHHATRFCLFTIGSRARTLPAVPEFVFFARKVDQLREAERHFTLSSDEIGLLNPNTLTCPIFRSRADAELTKAIYRRIPVLVREAQIDHPEENQWGARFSTMFHMSNDSHLFRTRVQLKIDGWLLEGNIFRKDGAEYLPLYEAKMIHHFDHRWGTYEGQTKAQANQGKLPELDETQHADPNLLAFPRYWVKDEDVRGQLAAVWNRMWLTGFRDITGATVFRTVILSIIPRVAVGHTCPVILPCRNASDVSLLVAVLSSFAIDFTARQKVGGTHLTYGYFNQLPVPSLSTFSNACMWSNNIQFLRDWFLPRIMEMTYTAWDLEPFAHDCHYSGPPFRWDEERRFLIRCELDAAFFHLYLPTEPDGNWRQAENETAEDLLLLKASFHTPRDAVAYIMETFPIVKRKDEARWGTYRTKDTILEIYDAMAVAIRTGVPFKTSLVPLPGPPTDATENFIPMDQWDLTEWPSHIHPPRQRPIERPKEVPLEEFAYPISNTDKAICAASLAIVEQSQSISSADHLDCLLLATHPEWCKIFLDQNEIRAFEIARNSAPNSLFVAGNQSIRWKECRDYLEHRHAIIVQRKDSKRQPVSPGITLESVRNGLPDGVDEIAGFALKAMRRIEVLRKNLSSALSEQRRIIHVLEKQNTLYRLAA